MKVERMWVFCLKEIGFDLIVITPDDRSRKRLAMLLSIVPED